MRIINNKLYIIIIILLCSIGVISLALWPGESALRGSRRARGTVLPGRASTRNEAVSRPLSITPLVTQLFKLPAREFEVVCGRIQPPRDGHLSVSLCLHVLRAHGTSGRLERRFVSSESILELLTDDEAARREFDQPPMVATRSGFRYALIGGKGRNEESHRDQVLSTMAELGVPLSHPVRVAGGRFQLAETLKDSMANFHLGQEEISWTATAYALYWPAQEWTNRFGERFSFDGLARELLSRPLNRASCGGTHLLSSMTILARADEERSLLSSEIRDRLRDRLKQCAAVAVRHQDADGSWPSDWNNDLLPEGKRKGRSPIGNRAERLLVTGHLAEWMLYLPREQQVPTEVLTQAGLWLHRRLLEASEEELYRDFCPHVHAACVVRQLASVSEDTESARVSHEPPIPERRK
jgi:hypothetical protein